MFDGFVIFLIWEDPNVCDNDDDDNNKKKKNTLYYLFFKKSSYCTWKQTITYPPGLYTPDPTHDTISSLLRKKKYPNGL